jgi:hypothetical protein
MKATVCSAMHKLSILVTLLSFSTFLTAQVKIYEKIEIAPQTPTNLTGKEYYTDNNTAIGGDSIVVSIVATMNYVSGKVLSIDPAPVYPANASMGMYQGEVLMLHGGIQAAFVGVHWYPAPPWNVTYLDIVDGGSGYPSAGDYPLQCFGYCCLMVHVTKVSPIINTCVTVIPERPTILVGDTVNLFFQGDYSADQLFDIEVFGGGTLLAPDGKTDIYLTGVRQPIKYIAPSTIIPGGAIGSIRQNDTLSRAGRLLAKMNKVNPSIKTELQAQDACDGGDVTVKDDKCPQGTECTSEPILPRTAVAIKASGEISGETLPCLPDSNGKLPLAQFEPISNSDKAFEYNVNGLSVCCDQTSKSWVLQIPPITFNSIIGLCENNLQNITDLATLNVLTLSNTDRCLLKAQLKNGQNTTFTVNGNQYYLKDATLTHEDVHRKNIADAVKKVYDKWPGFFKIPKSEYKTVTEAMERAKENLKTICRVALVYAEDFRSKQIGKNTYESETQKDKRVQDIYTNFIETKLKYPSDDDCKSKYGVN